MRYLLLFIFTIVTIFTNAQQVNPVTDYTFANKMSAGRSTVTDTAAYFSVGPRFGAIRGMMPPMVVDTAVVSANKRNGLLIFSVQRNKFLVWDSAGSKWADITGAAGSAITSADTASMLLPYLRKVDTTAMLLPYLRKVDTTAMLSPYLKESDTIFLSNRINLKVNISDTSSMLNPYLRGLGTANYLPKFNASRSIVDSKVYETGTNLMFNTTTPYISSSGYGTFDINGSTASVLVLRKTDTARGYWSHNGSTMDINNLSAGDIRFYTQGSLRGRFQTDGTFRLNSLTGTGTRSVVADANGVLSASSTPTDLIDTTFISTRAWRQKGDDSLGAIIATKGSGTITSVATGYGLSGGTITTTGTIIVDSAIVASRLRVGKVVDSLALVKQNVLTNPVTGTGTTNYVPKFTGTSTIGNSLIFDNGTNVGINNTSPSQKLDISGNINMGGTSWFRYENGGGYFGSATTTSNGYARETAIRADSTLIFASGGSTERMRITASGEILVNTFTDAGAYVLQANGAIYNTGGAVFAATSGNVGIGTTSPIAILDVYKTTEAIAYVRTANQTGRLTANDANSTFEIANAAGGNITIVQGTSTERARFNANGEFLLNTTLDAGDYKLQVSGNAYVSGLAHLAVSSGNVGIGSTSPQSKLWIVGGSLATGAGNDGAGISSNLTTGRTGTFDAGTLSSYHNYYDNHSIEMAAGSTGSWISGVSVTGRGATNFAGTVRLITYGSERIRVHGNGGLKFVGQSAAPTAEAGTVYYDTDDNKLKVYNGTTWVDLH